MVTEVELEAVFEEQMLPLGEAMRLAVGTTVPLNVKPDSFITLRCGHVPLLRGHLGRVGDHIAILVDDRFPKDEVGG